MIELKDAVVVCPVATDRHQAKAVAVLIEEIARRTGVTLARAATMPPAGRPAVLVGTEASLLAAGVLSADLVSSLQPLARPGREGFWLLTRQGASPTVAVIGSDARGVLYGVGRLLRKLHWSPGRLALPDGLAISAAPQCAIRGHQLGYRPLNNTYDAWTVAQYEQYIRELALFGCNCIEFVPPGADDQSATAPHMKLDPADMLEACSRLCDDYGLDCSLWYPNEGADYMSADGVAAELAKREAVFARMPRLDVLFIPGGDPGNLDIDVLFSWAERLAALLRQYHPRARMCLSAQAFKAARQWQQRFYEHLQARPAWLNEVAFAPWMRDSLAETRQSVPDCYPLRHYPDITHCYLCQYPVPNWDRALAQTCGREPINPRPRAIKHIHNLTAPFTLGSVTYSEGVNDDVNKFVWADQDWDPATTVEETLSDYARLFIGPDWAVPVTAGLLALEENWRGSLAENEAVEATLARWLAIDAAAPPAVRNNWRFQSPLLRACFDAYVRRRLIREKGLEAEAMAVLLKAVAGQSLSAIAAAEQILARASAEPTAPDLKQRIEQLADGLWENIGLQLTVSRHHGQRVYRGAFVDSIDVPLNSSPWLSEQFRDIRAETDESARLEAIRGIVTRVDTGPGRHYDDMGEASSWPRVKAGPGWSADPSFHKSPLVDFWIGPSHPAWVNCVTTRYGQPLTVAYDDLLAGHDYLLRVTLVAGPWAHHVRLHANGRLVHDFVEMSKARPARTDTFILPASSLGNGRVELTWTTGDGELGARVAEVWLTPVDRRDRHVSGRRVD